MTREELHCSLCVHRSNPCNAFALEALFLLLSGPLEAILSNFPELRYRLELHLRPIRQSDDHIAPFTDETGHVLHVFDDLVGEVLAVGARQAGHHRDAQIRETVTQKQSPEHRG